MGWNLSSIINAIVVVASVTESSGRVVISTAVAPLNGALILLKLLMGKLVPVQVCIVCPGKGVACASSWRMPSHSIL